MKYQINPYTYLLHHKPTNTWYYGVRWAKGCDPSELWVSYFSSSKYVALLRTLFGDDSFEFEVRHTFNDVKSAREWEHKVLRRMRVLEKPDQWLNRTDNRAILNGPMTDIHKNQCRINMIKVLENNGHFTGAMNPMYGVESPTKNKHWYNDGYSEDMFFNGLEPIGYVPGRLPYSQEHLEKVSRQSKNRIWINNGKQTMMIKPNTPIPEGYTAGRLTPWQ